MSPSKARANEAERTPNYERFLLFIQVTYNMNAKG